MCATCISVLGMRSVHSVHSARCRELGIRRCALGLFLDGATQSTNHLWGIFGITDVLQTNVNSLNNLSTFRIPFYAPPYTISPIFLPCRLVHPSPCRWSAQPLAAALFLFLRALSRPNFRGLAPVLVLVLVCRRCECCTRYAARICRWKFTTLTICLSGPM